eukprot:CAMPEP_0172647634 /NCGR_PEP_ID=MMETSP1068-20121228/240848_1 /TAXON_ID=35684 /ORGANISM="Pseudopedinella elastica, Strain CCMP716" /LENGTH=587 /DNA_ID=CAMNT_0013461915 /DNA_START=137 /DNA_END=1898 /DNA_ORIENTATION=-
MGKDKGDGNWAVNKRQLWAMRDGPQGRAFMCAADYTAASKTLETTGQNYGELAIDRSSSVQVVDRKAFPRHYHLYNIDDTKGLTFWEYLDPAASAASIKAGGRAVGYGVGVKETMAEFDENRRSQAKEETGAGLSIGAWSAPRSRLSKEQKKEAEVGVAASAEAKTAKRERAAAAARAVKESQHQNDVDVCDICATRFLSAGGLARHRNSGCGKRTSTIEKEKRKARRSVVRRLEAMDELVIDGNRQCIKDLALVMLGLSVPKSTAAVARDHGGRGAGARLGVGRGGRAAAAARAVKESQHQNDVVVCGICATRFLSAGGLARHPNSGCGKRTTTIEKEKRKARREHGAQLEDMDELVIEGNRQRIRDLALVTVDLSAPESTAAAVGIEVEDDGGSLVITAVAGLALGSGLVGGGLRGEVEDNGGSLVITAVAGLALGSGLVGEGFVAVSVGGDPASADSIPTELAAGQKATFVFRRPLPHIPFHGSARETIHKEPRFVMPREVEEWLREHAYDHDLGRDKMRPYVAYAALKAYFSGCLRNDTKTAVYLDMTKSRGGSRNRKKKKRTEQKTDEAHSGQDGGILRQGH